MASPKKKFVTLRSSDNEEFSVEEFVVMQARAIQHMIKDDCASNVISLPNVDTRTLRKVIEYCTKHADESLSEEELRDFDTKFVDVSRDDLFDLLVAGNSLYIVNMLACAVEKAASLMRGNNPEQIRDTFDTKNDFILGEEKIWAFQ